MGDLSVPIAAASVVFGATSAFWGLIYNRRQAKAVGYANALVERAQREQAEPYVVVDIKPRIPGSSLFVVAIENFGQTLARNVRIAVTPPLETTLGAERAAILNRAVQRPISTLPPKRRIVFAMDIDHQLFASGLPKIYEFRVEAEGPFGDVGPLTYTVDLDAMRETVVETDSMEWSLHQIAEHLKRSVDAQDGQARAIEALTDQLSELVEEQKLVPEPSRSVDGLLASIPMEPLGSNVDPV